MAWRVSDSNNGKESRVLGNCMHCAVEGNDAVILSCPELSFALSSKYRYNPSIGTKKGRVRPPPGETAQVECIYVTSKYKSTRSTGSSTSLCPKSAALIPLPIPLHDEGNGKF